MYNKQEMIEKAIVATRQLCKRQSTWLKNEKEGLILNQSDIKKAINFLRSHDA